MSTEMEQRLNTILLGFISVVVTCFATLWWSFYGSLPNDVAHIREDVSVIRSQQGALAQMQDQRMARMEKDIDRLERAAAPRR